MTTLDLDFHVAALVEEADGDGVLGWRYSTLRRAGYPPRDAARLARSRHVDLHAAVDLPARGCGHRTALRILL
jgi:hypothetical protein